MKKFIAAFTVLMSISSVSVFAAPADVSNYTNNYQQVILENVNAKVVTVLQQNINVNLNLNVNPQVNVNLEGIGSKFLIAATEMN